MRVSQALPISLLGAAIALAGCSGGAQSDGRLAAIQTALDAHPPFINVPNGTVCHLDVYWPAGNYPSKFKGLSYVNVKPAGVHRDMFSGTEPCTTVTWDASAHFTPQPGNEESGTIPIGRFIVDKVGDEQDGPLGMKLTPFKQHFEWSAIGKDMLARHVAIEPTAPADRSAVLHKDADGKWVAEIAE